MIAGWASRVGGFLSAPGFVRWGVTLVEIARNEAYSASWKIRATYSISLELLNKYLLNGLTHRAISRKSSNCIKNCKAELTTVLLLSPKKPVRARLIFLCPYEFSSCPITESQTPYFYSSNFLARTKPAKSSI